MQISQIFPHSQEGKKTEELKIKTLNKEKKKKEKKEEEERLVVLVRYTHACVHPMKTLTALIQEFWGLWKEMGNNEETKWELRFWAHKDKFHGE